MSRDIDQLITDWLDGSADDEGIGALEEALASSEGARRTLVLATRLHAALASGHAAYRGHRQLPRRWAVAAAALLAVAVGGLVVIERGQAEPQPVRRSITVTIERSQHPLPQRRISKLTIASDHRIRL